MLEVALRGGAVEADETVRVVEHEAAHHRLEVVGHELVAGEDVDVRGSPVDSCDSGKRVGQDVAVLAR